MGFCVKSREEFRGHGGSQLIFIMKCLGEEPFSVFNPKENLTICMHLTLNPM